MKERTTIMEVTVKWRVERCHHMLMVLVHLDQLVEEILMEKRE